MHRKWIAAVLAGRLLLTRRRMRHAMERPERRTRQPFQAEGPHDIRCDPHAYRASEFIATRLSQRRLGRGRIRHAASGEVTLRPTPDLLKGR